MPDPQYEYYQPLIDARDRLKRALQGTNMAEISRVLIKYEESEVNLRTEMRELNRLQQLSGDTNVQWAALLNDGLPLCGQAKKRCWDAGTRVYS